MHLLEAVEQVAFGVAVHVLEQIVGRVGAGLALWRPARHERAGGIGGRRDSGNARERGQSSARIQHANRSCARIRRSATFTPYGHCTVQPGHSPQRTAVCAASISRKRSRPSANWP